MTPRTLEMLLVVVALALLLLAACGGGGDDAARAPAGLTTATRTPSPATTPEAPRPAGTAVPGRDATPAPPPTGTPGVEPDALAIRLGELSGEDPALVMQGLELVTPRCEQDRETFGGLLERGWRVLNEQRGIRVPVSAMLGRIIAELPPGTERYNCESLIAAVITDLTQ